jgi:hypothetical protein
MNFNIIVLGYKLDKSPQEALEQIRMTFASVVGWYVPHQA